MATTGKGLTNQLKKWKEPPQKRAREERMDKINNHQIHENDKNFSHQLDKKQLTLLITGYFRESLTEFNFNHNPNDLITVTRPYLFVEWQWDFVVYGKSHRASGGYECYQCLKDSSFNPNRKVTLKSEAETPSKCAGIKLGMPPNSGIYKIQFKIHDISVEAVTGIGITAKNVHERGFAERIKTTRNKAKGSDISQLLYSGDEWLLWVSNNEPNAALMHGLHLGNEQCQFNFNGWPYHWNSPNFKNVFYYDTGFTYNGNDKCQTKLPPIKKNDVIVMEYNSNNQTITMSRPRDKIHATIEDLPPLTYFWIAVHSGGSATRIEIISDIDDQ